MSDICYQSAIELALQIRQRDLSPVDVVEAHYERIQTHNDSLTAYVTLIEDEAMEAAKDAERALDRGQVEGPLHGVPIAIKDLFAFKAGVRNTFGSIPLADFVPEETASYVQRLENAGAIVLGKTNTPELGSKGTTDNLLFGPTRNPYDTEYNAGGSTGGGAAAVAAGLAPIAHGSDAGGSLRIPASLCNLYTIKATYRRVGSRDRPNAFISHTTFEQHGPLTRTVADAALALDVMAGSSPGDPFSAPDHNPDYLSATQQSIDDLDIAYTPDFGTYPVEDRVVAVVEDALQAFETAGANVQQIEFPLSHSHQTLTETWMKEWQVNYIHMADMFTDDLGVDLLDEHFDELTAEVQTMIEKGTEISGREFRGYDTIRTDVLDAFESCFTDYDIVVSPTLACAAVENADDGRTLGPTEINGEDVDPQIGWCLTYLQNFTGHPTATIPAGRTKSGFPIGLQMTSQRYDEETLLAASAAFERVRPWDAEYPPAGLT